MPKAFYYYYYILQFSSVIPVLYGTRSLRRLDRPTKVFLSYLGLSLFQTVVMTILALQSINNLWIMNLSLPVNMGFLMWIYSMWQKNPLTRRMMLLVVPMYAIVWIAEIVFFESLFEFTKVSRPLEGLIFTLASCVMMYQIARESERSVLELPQFWISSGIMLYFGGMLAVSLFSEALYRSSIDSLRLAYSIQPALSLTAHLFYLGAFRCQCRQQTYSGLSSSVQP
jgi:hypothetical protein